MGAPFKVVIPSRRSENLLACLKALLQHEPGLGRDRILVIDDGARKGYPDAPVTWIKGREPFIFARNVNLGIKAAASDVIALNDDALLETPKGFHALAKTVQENPELGACSAAIRGDVGNRGQRVSNVGLRPQSNLAFICVYLPTRAIAKVGYLDEQFVGYGGEDGDYCCRIKDNGMKLGVFDGCVVQHGKIRSTFRTMPGLHAKVAMNRKLFWAKREAAERKKGEQP